ncbi:MAG: hypothetical protein WAU62_02885 [Dehalococcoidales bacterium]
MGYSQYHPGNVDLRLKGIIDRRARQINAKSRAFQDETQGLYYLDKVMPGIYIWAVIQACLDLNQKAIPAYRNIVEAWRESGNQSFLDECIDRGQKEGFVNSEISLDGFGPIPELCAKYAYNKDFLYLNKLVCLFILNFFNREIDRENRQSKMKAITSPVLYATLLTRSSYAYLNIELADLEKYQGGIDERMQKRNDRVKSKYVSQFHAYDQHLVSHAKIMKLATMWYTSYVLMKSVVDAADYYKLSPKDLGERLKPIREALIFPS